jgi:hypothetical protein
MGARKRKTWPMPVHTLFLHPIWRASNCATRGIIVSLLDHYWLTNRRPLPTEIGQLCLIGRCDRRTLRKHKADIERIIADCLPELDGYWRLREGGETGIRLADFRARQKREAMAKKLQHEQPRAAPGPAHVTGELPRTQPPAHTRPREDRPKGGFVG